MIKVMKSSDLGDGEMKEEIVNGVKILIAHAGNKFYAVESRCPHMGGQLAKGKLEGTIVTCPLHGGKFDLEDGHVVQWAPRTPRLLSATKIDKLIGHNRPLKIYPVKIEGDDIWVEI